MESERENIIIKVRNLFLKYGIKSVSMDDVARELGISKKTLYGYFADKEQLVRMVMEFEMENRTHCAQIVENKNLNAIEEVIEINFIFLKLIQDINPAVIYDLRKYYCEIHAKMAEMRRERMKESIVKNLEKGKREGLYRKNLNTEIIARMQISRLETITDTEIFTRQELSNEAIFNEMLIYHLYGICTPLGISIFKNKFKELNIETEE